MTCIVDIGGSGMRVKQYRMVGNKLFQDIDENTITIQFHKYIERVKGRNVFIKNNRKLISFVTPFKNCYVGATGGVRESGVKNGVYKVYNNTTNKYLFDMEVLSGVQEGKYELMAAEHKFKNMEALLSMGSKSCQFNYNNKITSVSVGFKNLSGKTNKFKILQNKHIIGISTLYWTAKDIETNIKMKLADNMRGVKINAKFIEKLNKLDMSKYDDLLVDKITLFKRIMNEISGPDTIIVFKREWKNPQGKYIINWPTGRALETKKQN